MCMLLPQELYQLRVRRIPHRHPRLLLMVLTSSTRQLPAWSLVHFPVSCYNFFLFSSCHLLFSYSIHNPRTEPRKYLAVFIMGMFPHQARIIPRQVRRTKKRLGSIILLAKFYHGMFPFIRPYNTSPSAANRANARLDNTSPFYLSFAAAIAWEFFPSRNLCARRRLWKYVSSYRRISPGLLLPRNRRR